MPADLHIAGSRKPQAPAPGLYEPLVPGQLAEESFELVDRIHRLFLQAAETELSELLQSPVKMIPRETEQSIFSKSPASSPAGDRVIALDLSPVPGCGFLSFSRPLLFGVLDILLATPGNPMDDSGRIVTAIELHVLRELFELIGRTLADTWKQFYPAAFRQLSMPDDELEQRVAAIGSDPALILSANAELGGISGEFRLMVPTCLARIAELKVKSAATSRAEHEPIDNDGILERLGDARLEIDAVLQGASIRIRDLLELAPGRILMVGNCDSSSFDCLVNGTPQFTGDLVSRNGRCGIQLGAPRAADLPVRDEAALKDAGADRTRL
jgi:flagellar motor switch protein FliM